MEFEIKLNNTGKVTAGSIVYFNYKGTQKIGIVFATSSSHNVYIVKHISNDSSKQGMIGTIKLTHNDIKDTKALIEKEILQDDASVYHILQKVNNLAASRTRSSRTRSSRTRSSPSRSSRTKSSPSRSSRTRSSRTRSSSSKITIDGDVYTNVDGGYRAKSIIIRSKKNRRKTKLNRRKH